MKHTLAALLLVTIALPITPTLAQQFKTDRGNGIITYGEAFSERNGYKYYETEGAPVAISENGAIFELSPTGAINYDKVLKSPSGYVARSSQNYDNERAKAKSAFAKNGTTDGSSFERAFQNQTIRGYGAPLDEPRYVPSSRAQRIDNIIGKAEWGQTIRDFNGVKVYGEPFRTTADGTRFFETESAPVAIGPDNTVYSLDEYNNIKSRKPNKASTSRKNSAQQVETQERAKAKRAFAAYGTTDGSSFEKAFQNQTIRGYGAPLDEPRYVPSSSPTIGGGYAEPLKRNFNGVETIGKPFKTTSDGTRFFETEGQPVAVTRDNSVYGLDDNNNINRNNPLGQTRTTNTSPRTSDSVLRKFGLLSKDNSRGSPSNSSSNGDKPKIKPFSFANLLNGRSAGGNSTAGNYVSTAVSGQLEGFALALTPEEVRERRYAYSKRYNSKAGGMLEDAIDGDGKFMGQQTGNVFKGNFTGLNSATTKASTGGSTNASLIRHAQQIRLYQKLIQNQ